MDSREANPPVQHSFPRGIASKTVSDKVYFGSQTLSDFILTGPVTPLAATAVYDSVLKAPKCGSLDSSCDSGTLLNGRDSLATGAEPNQPNTINNSNSDGSAGTYHSDESIDAIKVSTQDGGLFAPGKIVKIEVTVWAWSTPANDHLDLYYAADASNPSWIYHTTLEPSVVGAQVLSTTYTLPTGATLQAVRARFRYQGTPSSCSASFGCIFDDYDDLIFGAWNESTVSGQVTNGTGSGLSGKTVTLTGDPGSFTSAPTNGSGNYSVTVPRGYSYTATANGSGESFVRYGTPNSSLQPLSGNVTNFNFAKNTPQYETSGFVRTIDGFDLEDVTVFPSASGHVPPAPGQCDSTDSTGRFVCFGLWQDTSYSIVPTKENYVITPASLSVSTGGLVLQFTAHQMATVTTAAATSIGSTTATLNGSVNPHGEAATNARFEWGTDPALASYNETPLQAIATGTSDQAFSQNIPGLVAGTNYYFRAFASNSLGDVRGLIVPFTTLPPGTAEYDGALKAPKCGSVYKLCDSGTLLDGRDNITGGAEPNQPNTINNSCDDGTTGNYHSDESIDKIKVSTLSGANFAPGKTVKIEVTVWVFSASDHLDLYYAADASNPNWIYRTTLEPSVAGAQVLSTTYDLPNGAGLQAVRASFRYGGSPSSCGGNSGYDDHDDLIFAVQSAVQFSAATYSKPEDGGTATITVMRTGGSTGAASVQFSNPAGGTATGGASCTAGVDYITPSGTLNWADGDAADQTFAVTLCSDSTVENNETVNLSLSNATGAALGIPTSATLTITNDDTNVSVAVSPSSAAEDGATNLVYTFTRTGVTTGALPVNFSVGGTATFNTDYTQTGAAPFAASSGTVTFGAGNSTATVTIDPSVDSTVESNETAILTVTSGTGYNVGITSAATGTINNDDTDVAVAVSPLSVAEDGAPNLVYTFTRNGLTTSSLTVNFSVGGTAAFSTDYTQTGAAAFAASSGTVTIGAGNSTATVTINPAVDSTVEPDETAILTVTSGTGYNVGSPSSATGTINNDDGVVLIIATVTPAAGRTSGGQQIILTGTFAGLSTVMMGGTSATWVYTNGGGDTSSITVTTPAHAVGAVQIDLTPTAGSPYSKANAFAYLPTVFTDDTITVGVTTAKAQHILELRQAVDAMRAVAGLSGAPWTDPGLAAGGTIKAIHILDLRTYLDDAATRLAYSPSAYTDPSLAAGFLIKRIHIEELRQRIRNIAG
ncbi:MAG: Calx-beta domain-containing protein [Acidobacteriota bacterium]